MWSTDSVFFFFFFLIVTAGACVERRKGDILVIILGSPLCLARLVLTEEAWKAFAHFTVHVHACLYIIQNCMCINFLQNLV